MLSNTPTRDGRSDSKVTPQKKTKRQKLSKNKHGCSRRCSNDSSWHVDGSFFISHTVFIAGCILLELLATLLRCSHSYRFRTCKLREINHEYMDRMKRRVQTGSVCTCVRYTTSSGFKVEAAAFPFTV